MNKHTDNCYCGLCLADQIAKETPMCCENGDMCEPCERKVTGRFDYCKYCLDRVQCTESNWACTFDKDGFVCDNLNLPLIQPGTNYVFPANRDDVVDVVQAQVIKDKARRFTEVDGCEVSKTTLPTNGAIVEGIPPVTNMPNITKDMRLIKKWGEDRRVLEISLHTNGVSQSTIRLDYEGVQLLTDLCRDWIEQYERRE
jgi:hypothetical protein